jgi:hypothetical protein
VHFLSARYKVQDNFRATFFGRGRRNRQLVFHLQSQLVFGFLFTMDASDPLELGIITILNGLIAVASDLVANDAETVLFGDQHQVIGDHRSNPRKKRRKFNHKRALESVLQDYVGPEPLYDDGGFQATFRVTKQRFDRILNDVIESNNSFFFPKDNAQASPFVRLLYPLKTLAYGTSSSAFEDYFQLSNTMAGTCSEEFDLAICNLYTREYLRQPTSIDLQRIEKLHNHQHGVPGMLGSLDCMHLIWKNCPKAWQGSFVGKEQKPSIVLEAVADYNLWFWHSFFGSGGSFNDLNILDVSNLLKMILNGVLDDLEQHSGAVPYDIGNSTFNKLFYLVDGIYPKYSRFVRGIKDPTNQIDSKYTEWQEGARKDIERAFGVLQIRFQWTARPVQLHNLDDITRRMKTCLILHNMGVSDRVMDNDVHALYDPSFSLDSAPELSTAALSSSSEEPDTEPTNLVGTDAALVNIRWQSLNDKYEHTRLLKALKDKINN